MRIAICEDDAVQAKLTTKYINEWGRGRNTQIEIHNYNSAESFLFSLEEEGPFDTLMLDIQMSEMTGVELAKELRRQHNDVIIIFVTALREHVFAGYDVDALQYILKPINKEKLFLSLDKAEDRLYKSETVIILDNQKIKQNDIMYIEAQAHYIDIYLKDKTIRTKKTLKDIYDLLDNTVFYLCHRSYIVNISKIEKIQKEELDLENEYKIPVSRSKYKEINTAFISFFTGKEVKNEL